MTEQDTEDLAIAMAAAFYSISADEVRNLWGQGLTPNMSRPRWMRAARAALSHLSAAGGA
jgi:hypothetical protein